MKKKVSEERIEELLVDFTESLTGKDGGSEKIDSLSAEAGDAASLFDTVRTISSVLQPGQPSEEFAARLPQIVRAQMRIRRIVDMLAADRAFREKFFRDMDAACREVEIELTSQEITILSELKEDAMKKDAIRKFTENLGTRLSEVFSTSSS